MTDTLKDWQQPNVLLTRKLGDSQLNQLLHKIGKGCFTELIVEGIISHIVFFCQIHTIKLTM
jgi:hypothetical protein